MAMIKGLSWANPWAAWLTPVLVLLAGLLLLEARRRVAFLKAFGDGALVRGFSRLDPEGPRRLRPLLLALALTGIVAALARPVLSTKSEVPDRPRLDVVLLLDVSRSMGAEDYGPRRSRLDRAKAMILEALPELAGRKVGVVTFAGAAFRQAPLVDDHAALAYVLANWVFIESAPGGGSDLAEGIRAATRLFEDRSGERLVLLFSDGGQAQGEKLRAALAEARSKAARIFAFGLGGPVASRIPEYDTNGKLLGWVTVNGQVATTRLDEPVLKQVAAVTDGGYARVVSGRELRHTLGRLRIAGVVSPGGPRELFQWPLAGALILLLLEAGSAGLTGRRVVGAVLSLRRTPTSPPRGSLPDSGVLP